MGLFGGGAWVKHGFETENNGKIKGLSPEGRGYGRSWSQNGRLSQPFWGRGISYATFLGGIDRRLCGLMYKLCDI